MTGSGPLRARHAVASGGQRKFYRFSIVFYSVLLGDQRNPGGGHGRSAGFPRGLPFAVYREMLKFPTFCKDSGAPMTGSSGLPGPRPAWVAEKVWNFQGF